MAISLADTYVQTLLDLEKSGATKDAAERFVAIVKRRGHARLLPQILAKYERAKTGETARGLQIRVASERVQLPPLPLGEGWGEGPGAELPSAYTTALANFEFNRAADVIWNLIETLDRRIAEEMPFKVIKTDEGKGRAMILALTQDLYLIARLLNPIMPATSATIKESILQNKKPTNLFPRKE